MCILFISVVLQFNVVKRATRSEGEDEELKEMLNVTVTRDKQETPTLSLHSSFCYCYQLYSKDTREKTEETSEAVYRVRERLMNK